MQDCYETSGSHAFIYGPRGVGKTSLGHTSCEKHEGIVEFAAAIACDRDLTLSQLMEAIVIKTLDKNRVKINDSSFKAKLAAFGIEIGADVGARGKIEVSSSNDAVAVLNTVFSISRYPDKIPVVIVDEFDLLKNPDTLRLLTSILKQISVDGLRLKFVFCGVAKNLIELMGAHESVERYVFSVGLNPLTHDAIQDRKSVV